MAPLMFSGACLRGSGTNYVLGTNSGAVMSEDAWDRSGNLPAQFHHQHYMLKELHIAVTVCK